MEEWMMRPVRTELAGRRAARTQAREQHSQGTVELDLREEGGPPGHICVNASEIPTVAMCRQDRVLHRTNPTNQKGFPDISANECRLAQLW